jgi:hypothetical protein
LTIAGLAIFTARKRNQSARRAQKITLGAAFFDKEGRILVDTDGLIPSTVVTDSFIQTVSNPRNGKEGDILTRDFTERQTAIHHLTSLLSLDVPGD